jgi:hypothetical protein
MVSSLIQIDMILEPLASATSVKKHNFTSPEMFRVFLQIVNGATQYNSNGKIIAIPIIVYHDITTSLQDYTKPSHAASTTLDLFDQEMKYLHDNGFRVFVLNQLEYDLNNNVFYIKEIG